MIALLALLFFSPCSHSAQVKISAHYREAADIFFTMDCVSGWWDGSFCSDGDLFQKVWKERFGLSEEDQNLFKQYDLVRSRYYRGKGAPKEDTGPYSDGLFAKKSGIAEDLLAPSFLSSPTLPEAFKKLETVASPEDLQFLKNFYQHFQPSYQKILAESGAFQKKVQTLNKQLRNPKYQKFFEKISQYYSVNEELSYEVLFTWFPPVPRDHASPTDRFLVLQQNPVEFLNSDDQDVVFHEIVHTLSARQPQQQKEEISKAFLSLCPIENKFAKYQKGKILEEPLAVAIGQILFLKEFSPTTLKWDSKLYNNPWISAFGKNIYPLIESEIAQKKRFTESTGRKLGFLCNEMVQAMELLKKP